ncbi:MAG TPA: tyrosine-type recombinase/integrase [Verrucomicrobiae bacterium]
MRRKKSRFWTACYTNRDGRQLKRSTKTTDKRQALQIAMELERVERQANAGAITTIQLRKVLNDVSERINGDSLIAPSVEDYLNDWLKGIAARNRAATIERYGKTKRLFLESLGDKAQKPVTSLTPKDIETFLNERLKTGVAPQTAIIDLKTINTAFRRAEAYGIILKNPVAAVQMPKNNASEREVFTHEEVQKMLNAVPFLEWQTLILFGYFMGARLGDCVHMKWENIHPEQGVIIYHQQKTGKKVIVPMHFHVIEHLKYISTFGTTGFMCPKLVTKGSGGKHGLSEGFKRIVIKAGLDPMEVKGKGIRNFTKRTFHSLRHSFNSALANAGISEEVRMKLTGHSSKAMNQNYTHLQMATLKNAMTALPMFGSKAK